MEVHPHDAALHELLPAPRGLALDVGCGEGRLSRLLRSLGHDTVGVDRSSTLVEAARAADPDGRYEVASIDELPVGDGAAALVVCVNVLPHVVELDAAARELGRVLGAGGALVVGLAHPVMLAGRFDREAGSITLQRYFHADPEVVELGGHRVHHQQRTIEEYLRAFFAVGLALTDVREVAAGDADVPRYLDLRFERR
jgi:SAM-dependent methyltransferase